MKPFHRVAVWKTEVKEAPETSLFRNSGQRQRTKIDIRLTLPIVAIAVASAFMPEKSAWASVENKRAGKRM